MFIELSPANYKKKIINFLFVHLPLPISYT